ncbi:cyclase family protein [Draconibacterium mangrovi]|uniref:cyclase family protein n=1 Tax=Draconibacterium mangrovi TaxID=2697469 RepID=UPI0013CFD057|nr:cyclase family protein [Draconibacterium mangrovi]
MEYIFLSHILSDKTPSYGNRDKFEISPNTSINKGDTANTSSWSFSNNHFGTHIDLPYHFYNNGKQMQDYDANSFLFNKVQLIDIHCNEGILIDKDSYDWNTINENIDLLLIRTGFENKRANDDYWMKYPGIASDLCHLWREKFKSLRCIGFDFISLTSPLFKAEGKKAHQVLLKPEADRDGIWIIEDMSLMNIKDKINKVLVAPIRVENGNGGPGTVMAEI